MQQFFAPGGASQSWAGTDSSTGGGGFPLYGWNLQPTDPRIQPFMKMAREKEVENIQKYFIHQDESPESAKALAESAVAQVLKTNPLRLQQIALMAYHSSLTGGAQPFAAISAQQHPQEANHLSMGQHTSGDANKNHETGGITSSSSSSSGSAANNSNSNNSLDHLVTYDHHTSAKRETEPSATSTWVTMPLSSSSSVEHAHESSRVPFPHKFTTSSYSPRTRHDASGDQVAESRPSDSGAVANDHGVVDRGGEVAEEDLLRRPGERSDAADNRPSASAADSSSSVVLAYRGGDRLQEERKVVVATSQAAATSSQLSSSSLSSCGDSLFASSSSSSSPAVTHSVGNGDFQHQHHHHHPQQPQSHFRNQNQNPWTTDWLSALQEAAAGAVARSDEASRGPSSQESDDGRRHSTTHGSMHYINTTESLHPRHQFHEPPDSPPPPADPETDLTAITGRVGSSSNVAAAADTSKASVDAEDASQLPLSSPSSHAAISSAHAPVRFTIGRQHHQAAPPPASSTAAPSVSDNVHSATAAVGTLSGLAATGAVGGYGCGLPASSVAPSNFPHHLHFGGGAAAAPGASFVPVGAFPSFQAANTASPIARYFAAAAAAVTPATGGDSNRLTTTLMHGSGGGPSTSSSASMMTAPPLSGESPWRAAGGSSGFGAFTSMMMSNNNASLQQQQQGMQMIMQQQQQQQSQGDLYARNFAGSSSAPSFVASPLGSNYTDATSPLHFMLSSGGARGIQPSAAAAGGALGFMGGAAAAAQLLGSSLRAGGGVAAGGLGGGSSGGNVEANAAVQKLQAMLAKNSSLGSSSFAADGQTRSSLFGQPPSNGVATNLASSLSASSASAAPPGSALNVDRMQQWIYRVFRAYQQYNPKPNSDAWRRKLSSFVQNRVATLATQPIDWTSFPIPTIQEILSFQLPAETPGPVASPSGVVSSGNGVGGIGSKFINRFNAGSRRRCFASRSRSRSPLSGRNAEGDLDSQGFRVSRWGVGKRSGRKRRQGMQDDDGVGKDHDQIAGKQDEDGQGEQLEVTLASSSSSSSSSSVAASDSESVGAGGMGATGRQRLRRVNRGAKGKKRATVHFVEEDATEDFIPLTVRGGKGRRKGCRNSKTESFKLLSANSQLAVEPPSGKWGRGLLASGMEERKRVQRMRRFTDGDSHSSVSWSSSSKNLSMDFEMTDGAGSGRSVEAVADGPLRRMTWREKLAMMGSVERVVGKSQELEKGFLRLCGPPDPAVVRPEGVLRKSLDFVMQKFRSGKGDWRYLEEQFRSIRQDLTVQALKNAFSLHVYETNARLALENGDLGQFNACQAQLPFLYSIIGDAEATNRIEFLVYRILYMTLQNMRLDLLKLIGELTAEDSLRPEVKYALNVRKSLAEGNFCRCFRLMRSAPFTAAKLFSVFVPRLRMNYLLLISKGHYKVTVGHLKVALNFDTITECHDFLDEQGTVWDPTSKKPGMLPDANHAVDCRKSFPIFEKSPLLQTRKVKALG